MSSSLKYRGFAFFTTFITVVVVDQLTKFLIRSNISVGDSIPESGFFRLTHVQNTGAAFSLFENHTLDLIVVGIIEIIIVVFAFLYFEKLTFLRGIFPKILLGLILGGIIGNLIDRIRLGYVTDFIDVSVWPIFNIADSAGVIGILIMIYLILFTSGKKVAQNEPH